MRPEHWAREIIEICARGRGWGANEGATMLARAPRAYRRSGDIDGDDAIARRTSRPCVRGVHCSIGVRSNNEAT